MKMLKISKQSKKTPLISVVTCTYNSQEFLYDNISSVIGQKYDDYEHVFIDGFSTDNTLKILKDYQCKSPDKVRIYQQKPRGISSAMNKGIAMARGKYIIHLHSDDYFHDKEVLSDVGSHLGLFPKIDWIYGQIKVIERNGQEVGIFPSHNIFKLSSKKLLKYINFIPHQAVFIKKSVFNQYGGFDETLKNGMDQDLWLRINNQTVWKYYNRLISCYRVHNQAQSSRSDNYVSNRLEYKKIQAKYLTSKVDLLLAKVFNYVEERFNKTVR